MKQKIAGIILLIVCGLFLFTSFKTYHTTSLQPIGYQQPSFAPCEEGIHVSYKVYTPKECEVYLDYNLLDKGVQPIQVSIQNNTVKTYILAAEEVDLPTMKAGKVTGKYVKDVFTKSLGFRVLSILYLPMAIPGLVYDFVTTKTFLEMNRDYRAKIVKEEGEVILPYSLVSRVIFIPSDELCDEFSISLVNETTGKKEVFTAPLRFSVDSNS